MYRPVDQRTPDSQYKDLLRRILTEGEWFDNQMGEPALTLLGVELSFNLANGAPFITERDIVSAGITGRSYASQAIGEIIAFLNGARTQEELESFGCYWWEQWVSAEKCAKRGLQPGDLGPGSYGAAWTDFPTQDGGSFNQVEALIAQIRAKPHLRTHVLSPWVPQYIFRAPGYEQKVVVVPCHGWVNVHINTRTGEMTFIHHHRSADVPVGLPANMVGYAAFALMLAKITGYTLVRIIFKIDDAHIYESQLDAVRRLLAAEDRTLPTVHIAVDRQAITDFRFDDFVITDYFPAGPRMKIPTPV